MDAAALQPMVDLVSTNWQWFHDYVVNFSWFLVGMILGMGFIYGFFR